MAVYHGLCRTQPTYNIQPDDVHGVKSSLSSAGASKHFADCHSLPSHGHLRFMLQVSCCRSMCMTNTEEFLRLQTNSHQKHTHMQGLLFDLIIGSSAQSSRFWRGCYYNVQFGCQEPLTGCQYAIQHRSLRSQTRARTASLRSSNCCVFSTLPPVHLTCVEQFALHKQ